MSARSQPFVSYVQHNFLSNFGLKLQQSDSGKLWVGKMLGAGSEGEVFLGTYDPPQLMAIKFIRKTPETEEKFKIFLKSSLLKIFPLFVFSRIFSSIITFSFYSFIGMTMNHLSLP